MKRNPRTIALLLILPPALLMLAGCDTLRNMTVHEDVKPWQRNILAQESMQIPPDDMLNFSDEHIFFSKEASTGGTGVGGGGCGCN